MRKYSSKLARKLIVNKIINECERLRTFDVRASFGEECDSYDEKKDIFVYRGKDFDSFSGVIKGVSFEYINNSIYCFALDKKDAQCIGVFRANVNGKYSDVSDETRYFDIKSKRGKELLKSLNNINTLKDKFVTNANSKRK